MGKRKGRYRHKKDSIVSFIEKKILLYLMKTLKDIADALQQSRTESGTRINTLVERTGLTAVTLRGLLTGTRDSRLTTLMAVADELGLALVLVPKAVAGAIEVSGPQPEVASMVELALKRKREGA